jgi:hypothetical protein
MRSGSSLVSNYGGGGVRLHWQAKNFFRFLLKFRVILIVLKLLNPNMTNKLPCHTPVLREEGLN